MTNEELALSIQKGETGLFTELWDQIQLLGAWWAKRHAHTLVVNGIVHDEADAFQDLLYGCCFPAVYEAVYHYDPEKGNFTQLLFYFFRSEAAEIYGYRTSKRDAALYSLSLDQPVSGESDDLSLEDMIPCDSDQFEAVEHRIFQEQLKQTIDTALEEIEERSAEVLRQHYFQGRTQKQIADSLSMSQREIISEEQRAIRQIRTGKHLNELRSFLQFDYYSEGLRGAGVSSFRQTGSSATERAAFKAIKSKAPSSD